MSTRIKGAALVARRAYVEQSGDQAWPRVVRKLPPHHQAIVAAGLLASSWYPFELKDLIDAAIVAVLAKGDRRILSEIGSWVAQKNLTGCHRAFLTPGDPESFLLLTPRIYSVNYESGSQTFETAGPGSGMITTRDAGAFSETNCLTLLGWYRQGLVMCGAREVTLLDVRCRARGDQVCQFEVHWAK